MAHHGQQPLRDAVRALGAQACDRFAHLRVGEPLEQRVLVLVEVDAWHGRYRRRPFFVHVGEEEPPEQRVPGRLVDQSIAGEIREVAQRLVPSLSSRSFISSYGLTSSTTWTPPSS